MNDVLTGTPAELTYMHPIVVQAWTAVWAVTSGALVVIIGWIGLSLIVSEHLGRPQAGWRELVPRLVLGLVAAASSLWWCALVIDTADAVSGFIAAALGFTAADLMRASVDTLLTAVQTGSAGVAILIAILYLVYGFFVLYVLVQMLLRIALIDLLLALAPIALGLWILPHTAGWGKHWLRLFMTAVFQQAIQLIALSMGFTMLNEFAAIGTFEPAQDLIWKLILSAAFIYLATRVPSLLGNAGHVRRLAPQPLLRHVAPRHGDARRPLDRPAARWSCGRAGRHGRRRDGRQRRGGYRGRHRRHGSRSDVGRLYSDVRRRSRRLCCGVRHRGRAVRSRYGDPARCGRSSDAQKQ